MQKGTILHRLAWGLLCAALAFGQGCSTKPGSSNGPPPGKGYCQDTCTKDCNEDSDCDTSRGELCCDLADAGKTCLAAAQCPRSCDDDSSCDTKGGQVCGQVTLAVDQQYCTTPANVVRTCTKDSNCEDDEVCCGVYGKAICVPPSQCPKECAKSSECDTTNGEVCCTTVKLVEPSLSASGLCLNPQYQACPEACTKSTDCNTEDGEICCNGTCATSCPEVCEESSDCKNQICCKSALTRLPSSTVRFTTGPHCTGTPALDCSSSGCASLPGCEASTDGTCITQQTVNCSSLSTSEATCNSVTGCSYTASEGACTTIGTFTCSVAGSSTTTCASLAGCTFSDSGTCQTLTTVACGDLTESSCGIVAGCTWDATDSICTGTPTPCSELSADATTCATNAACAWYASGGCTGTPTPCDEFSTSTECATSPYNCSWSSGGVCDGAPVDCSTLVGSACASNPTCYWSTTASCTGKPTSCSALSNDDCSRQPGCSLTLD